MPPRHEVLAALAARILAVGRPHPVRVAVDGCSAAGKSTFTDALADEVRRRTGRPVIRASIDHFKRAVALRTAYPKDSPESYYLDYWDDAAIRDRLLRPLGPGGDRRHRTAVMNTGGTEPIDQPDAVAADDAVLLADGCFLQRPALDPHWDLRIYLHITFAEVLRRGTARDQAWLGSAALAAERYRTKYIPGERSYLADVRPYDRAQIVLDNMDPAAPRIVRG